MNRWPYHSVVCLVFNLETEWEREAQREHEMKKKEKHIHTQMYFSHGGRNLNIEPLASRHIAHRLVYFGVLDVVQKSSC